MSLVHSTPNSLFDQCQLCAPCVTAGGGAAADVTAWCEFHNGVAAGIKIAPRRRRRPQQHKQQQQQQHTPAHGVTAAGLSGSNKTTPQVAASLASSVADYGSSEGGGAPRDEPINSSSSSDGPDSLADTWLPHSKPVVPNYAHAGVLLALGLSGHLDRLSWTDLYR
jgi:hypothetical protein